MGYTEGNMTSFTLRDYQEEALEEIKTRLDEGVDRQLVVWPTGCHALGQDILMYDGRTKKVEDITLGDCLMGPDSRPRTVLRLIRNHGRLVRIVPTKGDPFVVNDEHVLTLQRTTVTKRYKGNVKTYPNTIVDVTVREWETWSKTKKHQYKLIRRPVYFFGNATPTPVDPYFLGVWLGDGTTRKLEITTDDSEIEIATRIMARRAGLSTRAQHSKNRTSSYHLVGSKGRLNPLTERFRDLDLLDENEKRVPHVYKTASRTERLELLAGILDADGHLKDNGVFDYISKVKQLAEDVAYIARSLGFAAYPKSCRKSSQNGTTGTYWRMCISGHIDEVPTRLTRKQAKPRQQIKDVLRTGFSLEEAGEGEYFGFSLDGDGRYLMGDFTVTHNSGKTLLFSHLPQEVPGKMLVLAHREELLEQAKDKILRANPDLIAEIEQADKHADEHADVVIGSVQTLGRSDSDRIEKFSPDHFTTVVVDEAHHAPAKTYINILNYFQPKLRLGVTATPQRSDKTRLIDVFDEIVHYRTIRDGIDEGYLTDLVGYRVPTDIDISDVTTRSGDYAVGELARAVNVEPRNRIAVETWQRLASDKKTLVFCADVAHAHDMAHTFKMAGVRSATVVGTTDKEDRKAIFEGFRCGDIQVLCNVMVATEGFDEPSIEAIILARPTKSQLLFTQIVGRGVRTHPGKDHCLIIDLSDATKGKKPVGLPTLMGLPPDLDPEGEALTEVADKFAELEAAAPEEAARVKSVSDIADAWERIDLFTPAPLNEEILEFSRLVWLEVGTERYVLNLANGERLTILGDALGRYAVSLKRDDGEHALGVCESMEEAFARSDHWVRKHRSDQLKLVDADAPWRNQPPTEKQLKYLRKFKVPITEEMTRGQASLILDKVFKDNPKPKRPKWLERKIQAQKRGW